MDSRTDGDKLRRVERGVLPRLTRMHAITVQKKLRAVLRVGAHHHTLKLK